MPEIQQAAEDAYENWRTLVRDKLTRSGFADDVAHDLAHSVMNMPEGAELSAQVSQSEAPLEIAGKHLARLVDCYRRVESAYGCRAAFLSTSSVRAEML